MGAGAGHAGWRIALIPIDDQGRTVPRPSGALMLACALGGLVFVGGAVCLLIGNKHLADGLLGAAVTISLAAIILRAINFRRDLAGWEITPAHCTDQEVRQVIVAHGRHGYVRWGWRCRAICQFKRGGQTYQVTPAIRISALGYGQKWFKSEETANEFMQAAIDSGGKCQLRVNPGNPRQTELLSRATRWPSGGFDKP